MDQPAALVIGAGPGIGAAAARRLAADGYHVGLVARSPARLAELATTLRRDGLDVEWAAADAADPAGLSAAINQLRGSLGSVGVLHHNISYFRPVAARALTAEEVLADLAVGAGSLLTAVQAVLPDMLAAGRGTVLATGSGTADRPMRSAASLGVQKAALRNLILALASDLAPDGVHAATVTIHGTVAVGTRFAPEAVAQLLGDLVAETAGPPDSWRTVVDLT